MARPRRITEEALLEAARQTFVRQGAAAPLSAVATRLGVSAPALLHRSGSKSQLMQQALASPISGVLDELRSEPTSGAAAPQLERLLLTLYAFLERQVPNIVVLRQAGLMPKPTGTAPTVALRRGLIRWLSKVPTRVASASAAEALLGALEARVFNRYLGGPAFAPGDDTRFIRCLVQDFLIHSETR